MPVWQSISDCPVAHWVSASGLWGRETAQLEHAFDPPCSCSVWLGARLPPLIGRCLPHGLAGAASGRAVRPEQTALTCCCPSTCQAGSVSWPSSSSAHACSSSLVLPEVAGARRSRHFLPGSSSPCGGAAVHVVHWSVAAAVAPAATPALRQYLVDGLSGAGAGFSGTGTVLVGLLF